MLAFIPPEQKIHSLESAVLWRAGLREQGLSLAVTNGCFDILHLGHAEYLRKARAEADALLVLINSDASVHSLKGPARPVNHENDRAFLLACLSFVDGVVIFDSKRCNAELTALAPDVYAKGGDYTLEKLDAEERRALETVGARVAFIPFVAGYSTTETIRKMRS